jgi:hypothetical protein
VRPSKVQRGQEMWWRPWRSRWPLVRPEGQIQRCRSPSPSLVQVHLGRGRPQLVLPLFQVDGCGRRGSGEVAPMEVSTSEDAAPLGMDYGRKVLRCTTASTSRRARRSGCCLRPAKHGAVEGTGVHDHGSGGL